MVVGEAEKGDDFQAGFAERYGKPVRTGDPAEGQELRFCQSFCGNALPRPELGDPPSYNGVGENASPPGASLSVDRPAFFLSGLDQQDVRPAEGGERLPQGDFFLRGIENDIQVPGQAAVLEAVVEDGDIEPGLGRPLAGGQPVLSHIDARSGKGP